MDAINACDFVGRPRPPVSIWARASEVQVWSGQVPRLPDALIRRDIAHSGLNLTNDRPKDSRREKSGTEWARGVLTEWWQLLKRRPDLSIHVRELPGDLVGDGRGLVRSGQPGRFRGVSGCAESVRAHVSDAGSLSSSPGGRHCRRRAHCVRGPISNEAPANFTGGIKFTLSKRTSTSDGITWSTVCRSLRFEQDQDSLSTVRRPHCDQAAVGFAQ